MSADAGPGVVEACEADASKAGAEGRLLADRSAASIWSVVDNVDDGDEVVLELTNGLRPITAGFLLEAGLLMALRPGVTVRAVTCGEFTLPNRGVDRLSPVHDLVPFLRLFGWANAVRSLSQHLDPGPFLHMVDGATRTLRRARSTVGHAPTAATFGDLLGRHVCVSRDTIELAPGDTAVVGQYVGPWLPEGATIQWYEVLREC